MLFFTTAVVRALVCLDRYEHYRRALGSRGLRVVPVEGDGNCLFRSVSHQVYGDDSHHRLVRARCMDYMEVSEGVSRCHQAMCVALDYDGTN